MGMKPNEVKDFLKRSLVKNPHRAIFVFGAVGIGKCIHFGSKSDFVVSGDGRLLHIKDLPTQSITLGDSYKLKKSKVKGKFNRSVTKLLRITTRTGKKIELTPEHPLFMIDGWKPADFIKEGDYIATPRNYNLNLTKTIDEDYVKILAYLLAEGHMARISFYNSDKIIVDELKESVERRYPILSVKKGSHPLGYNISKKLRNSRIDNPLTTDLKTEGLSDTNSETKFIPNIVMELSNKQIAIFLNRFFSCDGWVEEKAIKICLKSEVMIRQIQHLLLRFGIISTIRKKMKVATNTKARKKMPYWELYTLSNEGRRIFKEEVGLILKRKHNKIKITKTTNTNIDIIPIKPIKRQDYRNKDGRFRKGHNGWNTFLPKLPTRMDWIYPSRTTLLKFADYYDDPVYSKLATSDIFWDQVADIKVLKGKFEVWDMEIDEINHNFVVNDIIVHNSSVVKQVAQELKWEFRDVRLSLLDATDLRGLPTIDKDKKETIWTRPVFLPPEDYDKDMLIFLDEFNTSNKSMQNAALQLTLDRCIGEYRLPDKVRIICAGNNISDGAYVTRLSSALSNRFINIDFVTSLDDWKQWAYNNKINPLIIGFHNYRKGDLLHNYKEDVDNKAFATPRSWQYVSELMELGLENGTLFEAIKGAVGEGAGTEIYGFLKIYKNLPKPEDILLKGKDIVPEESNIMYALVSALINCVREHQDKIDRLIRYSLKIQKEFSVVLVKDLLKTDMQEKVKASKALDEWVRVNKDVIP